MAVPVGQGGATSGTEPTIASMAEDGQTVFGMNVQRESISVGILKPAVERQARTRPPVTASTPRQRRGRAELWTQGRCSPRGTLMSGAHTAQRNAVLAPAAADEPQENPTPSLMQNPG